MRVRERERETESESGTDRDTQEKMGDCGHIKNRKRIPRDGRKKLLLGHRVEVISLLGFLLSGHFSLISSVSIVDDSFFLNSFSFLSEDSILII